MASLNSCPKCGSRDRFEVSDYTSWIRCLSCQHEFNPRPNFGRKSFFKERIDFDLGFEDNATQPPDSGISDDMYRSLLNMAEQYVGINPEYTRAGKLFEQTNAYRAPPQREVDPKHRAEQRIAELEDQLKTAQTEVNLSKVRAVIDRTKMDQLRAKVSALELKLTLKDAEPARTGGIAPDMVRRLIQLCHPDKHGNSEASQKATQFLLGEKR